jgi:hypothetical protein
MMVGAGPIAVGYDVPTHGKGVVLAAERDDARHAQALRFAPSLDQEGGEAMDIGRP